MWSSNVDGVCERERGKKSKTNVIVRKSIYTGNRGTYIVNDMKYYLYYGNNHTQNEEKRKNCQKIGKLLTLW